MARIVLENLSRIFKGPKGEDVRAVTNLNLTIEDKEFLVLVGPSGCGKSTTLRMIAGLEEISQGTISIDGRIVNATEPKDRDLAMVFQNYALYPHMTISENMAFGLKLRKCPRDEIERRVREASDVLGITPLWDRLPKALSGGQRQRVAVGRAIVRQPKAFLFDEPLSNLDAQMRVQMRLEISKLHKRLAATMVYVTHDQVEAMTMGDRIAVMKEGVVQQVADPLQLYHHPANLFVAGFIGAPPMNFFSGTLCDEPGGLYFAEQAGTKQGNKTGFKLKLPREQATKLAAHAGRTVMLGLRPENVTVSMGGGPANSDSAVNAVVELVEPLGAETFFHLATAGHSFVARLGAMEAMTKPGQTVSGVFNLDRCHFFDPATGQAIF
jgi:multiple sugar transport system ATP-binding protein